MFRFFGCERNTLTAKFKGELFIQLLQMIGKADIIQRTHGLWCHLYSTMLRYEHSHTHSSAATANDNDNGYGEHQSNCRTKIYNHKSFANSVNINILLIIQIIVCVFFLSSFHSNANEGKHNIFSRKKKAEQRENVLCLLITWKLNLVS